MSGSLLLIAVVWLVLLAPLLLRNQRPVRRTAQALSETRVIMSGDSDKEISGEDGASMKRMPTLRKLKPAESLYRASDDEDLELVDAEPEYVVFDDEDESARPAGRLGKFASRLGRSRVSEQTVVEEDVTEEDVTEEEPTDVTDTSVDSPADEPELVDAEVVDADEIDADADAQTSDDQETGADSGTVSGTNSEVIDAELVDDDAADTEGAEPAVADEISELSQDEDPTGEFAAISDAYLRGGDVDTTVDMHEEVDEPQISNKNDDYLTQAQNLSIDESGDVTDEDIAYANSRPGRGIYNPVASEKLVEQRQKRRAQVLMGLAALTVVTGILGVVVGSFTWYVFAAVLAFTAFYLVMLRRTAVEEARLRQRRLARMRRARLGVRNTEDTELGIPDRLRRPGAYIVESDDMDPEFQHLGYIDSREFFDAEDRRSSYYYDEHHVRAV